jgi:hypothetical protein
MKPTSSNSMPVRSLKYMRSMQSRAFVSPSEFNFSSTRYSHPLGLKLPRTLLYYWLHQWHSHCRNTRVQDWIFLVPRRLWSSWTKWLPLLQWRVLVATKPCFLANLIMGYIYWSGKGYLFCNNNLAVFFTAFLNVYFLPSNLTAFCPEGGEIRQYISYSIPGPSASRTAVCGVASVHTYNSRFASYKLALKFF